MSRQMRNDKVIGGTSNNASAILYKPADTSRSETNVEAELDSHNTRLSGLELPEYRVGVEEVIGTLNGVNVYRKRYMADNVSITSDTTIDSDMKINTIGMLLDIKSGFNINNTYLFGQFPYTSTNRVYFQIDTSGLALKVQGYTVKKYLVEIIYTKAS